MCKAVAYPGKVSSQIFDLGERELNALAYFKIATTKDFKASEDKKTRILFLNRIKNRQPPFREEAGPAPARKR